MKVAIMQPTYLPWIGYFALMESVDIFIILDSVQFSKRSWQQRNQIKTESGPKWLTVPVISKGRREQLITDVEIDRSGKFPNNHINMIRQSYRSAPYFEKYSEELFKLLRENTKPLSILTIQLILLFRKILNINTEIRYSSEFTTTGSKDELLAELCHHVGATEYISPPGSRGYLNASNFFIERDITVNYSKFNHPQYKQLYGDFLPFMSVVDLLFNYGIDSLPMIKKMISNE